MIDRSNGYEGVAREFLALRGSGRSTGVGVNAVRQWAQALPHGAAVIDLGCGPGFPITEVLVAEGLNVFAIDAAPSFVKVFRRKLPDTPVVCEAVQDSAFFGRTFDAVLAWGLIFLLSPDDQHHLIQRIAEVLVPGGRLLFTSSAEPVVWNDAMTGLESRSLGAEEYHRQLSAVGLSVIGEYEDEGQNHYYDVRKDFLLAKTNMFVRYTERARRAIHYAVYFARQVGNTRIETEHLLLGVLRSDMTLANRFLGSPWAGETVWKKVEQRKPIREKVPGAMDMPLDEASKRALVLASEEADLVSSKRIGTEHLLLGLLREDKGLGAEILSELGVRLASTRQELSRVPHDDSKQENFMRERGPVPEDVAELQARVKSIKARLEDAISNHEFAKARVVSEEECVEHEKLVLLCRRYGLLDWIYD